MAPSKELQQFLAANSPWFRVLDSGKVHCELNGHAFPPNLQCLQAFVSGNKYQRLKKQKEATDALDKYKPFIVPSKNFPNMLYCALTGQLLETSLEAVKRHLKGKRFVKEKGKFEDNTQELRPEPDIGQIVEGLREEAAADGEGAEAGGDPQQPSSSDLHGKDDDMECSEPSSSDEEDAAADYKQQAKSLMKAQTNGKPVNGAAALPARAKKKVKPPAAKKQRV